MFQAEVGARLDADTTFFVRETEIDVPWAFGLELMNVWGHSADPQCCPGYPVPDPARGGADGLRAYVERLHAAGLRVGTYFESLASNPVYSNVTQLRGVPVSTLPAEQRPPPLDDVLAHAAMVDPGWAHFHGGNLNPGPTGLCVLSRHFPGSNVWRAAALFLLAKELVSLAVEELLMLCSPRSVLLLLMNLLLLMMVIIIMIIITIIIHADLVLAEDKPVSCSLLLVSIFHLVFLSQMKMAQLQ